jgi:glucose/arabinose dehydrogenase
MSAHKRYPRVETQAEPMPAWYRWTCLQNPGHNNRLDTSLFVLQSQGLSLQYTPVPPITDQEPVANSYRRAAACHSDLLHRAPSVLGEKTTGRETELEAEKHILPALLFLSQMSSARSLSGRQRTSIDPGGTFPWSMFTVPACSQCICRIREAVLSSDTSHRSQIAWTTSGRIPTVRTRTGPRRHRVPGTSLSRVCMHAPGPGPWILACGHILALPSPPDAAPAGWKERLQRSGDLPEENTFSSPEEVDEADLPWPIPLSPLFPLPQSWPFSAFLWLPRWWCGSVSCRWPTDRIAGCSPLISLITTISAIVQDGLVEDGEHSRRETAQTKAPSTHPAGRAEPALQAVWRRCPAVGRLDPGHDDMSYPAVPPAPCAAVNTPVFVSTSASALDTAPGPGGLDYIPVCRDLQSMVMPLSLAENIICTSDRSIRAGRRPDAMADTMCNTLELVAEGFSFPTSLTFDGTGAAYVAESGLPLAGALPGGRIWRVVPDGNHVLMARGLRPPVNGLTYHQGNFYVSEGGHPGRISRLNPAGERTTVLDNLPGPGSYYTNMVAFGPDGKLYFSQGAMTNSGIVGLDAVAAGWLQHLPRTHDLPGYAVTLAGVNIETANPLHNELGERVRTGAFVPFGTQTQPGERLPAQLPCTAGIMRCNPDGSELELVAWGLHNAYGIGFLPDGRLLATEQGADDRGSRPLNNVPDQLFEIHQGAWYGWPDFIGEEPVTAEQYRPLQGPAPTFVLTHHHELPPPQRPLLRFPAHTAGVKFAVLPASLPQWAGQICMAFFGAEIPMLAPAGPRLGRTVARIDPLDWSVHVLVADPLIRPIDVRFNPTDNALYILDFGQFEVHLEHGIRAQAGSGALWRLKLTEDILLCRRI